MNFLKKRRTLIFILSTLCWLIYLYLFYKFYQTEMMLVSPSFTTFQKSITLFSYNTVKSIEYFIGYLILNFSFLAIALKCWNNYFNIHFLIYVLVVFVINSFLMVTVYGYIFLLLTIINGLSLYVFITMSKLKNQGEEVFQIGDVVDIVGPFLNEPNKQQQQQYFLNQWELTNQYELEAEIILDDKEYYIEFVISEIKDNGDDAKNAI